MNWTHLNHLPTKQSLLTDFHKLYILHVWIIRRKVLLLPQTCKELTDNTMSSHKLKQLFYQLYNAKLHQFLLFEVRDYTKTESSYMREILERWRQVFHCVSFLMTSTTVFHILTELTPNWWEIRILFHPSASSPECPTPLLALKITFLRVLASIEQNLIG